ncbi:MAG: hypothetical protein FWG22_02510 [Prolixibacteraceae bacterium]|nr:hypothetical protein [Prolixibacteraceae bacterium]
MEILNPETVVVYGVTASFCADFVVERLTALIPVIYVVSDAINELPAIPPSFEKWGKVGVKYIPHNETQELHF